MKRENFLLVLLILFTVSGLNAQNLNCEIKGSFVDSTRYKYAYLVESKLNIFMKTPIIDQKFKFNLTQPENYQTTQLYFEEDSVKTNAYFSEQAKRLSDNRRIVAIENADLIFGNNALNMKVVMGKLNKDINEMYKAMETRDFQTFFDQHPDSEISISLLNALIRLNKISDNAFDCKTFFNKLSDRIKNSPEGKELSSKL